MAPVLVEGVWVSVRGHAVVVVVSFHHLMEGMEGVEVASAQDQEDLQTCLLEVEGVSDYRITVTR